MISWQQVQEAKEAMGRAEAALRAYVERPQSQPPDPGLHVQLADDLRESNRVYQDLAIGFSRSLSEIDFRFRGKGGASFFINHLV
jgi:hypothetical protein